MWEYLRRHEAYARALLDEEGADLEALLAIHEKRTARMQHERLIHLLVTLFVALFLLLAVGYAGLRPSLLGGALVVLLLVLTAAYIVHYFRLENGVQRWYELADRIEERLGRLPSHRESKETP